MLEPVICKDRESMSFITNIRIRNLLLEPYLLIFNPVALITQEHLDLGICIILIILLWDSDLLAIIGLLGTIRKELCSWIY